MTNLQKRILTSLVILPLSIFFVVKGGFFLKFFLLFIFLIANYELFLVFKKKITILFLNLILILSLFIISYLADKETLSLYFLIWIIILCVCSDVGGYVFGKTFKWKKFTSISPKKTLSGVFGSFIFSFISVFIVDAILPESLIPYLNFIQVKFFFLAFIFSLTAQAGDLAISYLKRLENIKDTGKILPGHGGIYDRIDSLMFVVILAFVFFKFNIIS